MGDDVESGSEGVCIAGCGPLRIGCEMNGRQLVANEYRVDEI